MEKFSFEDKYLVPLQLSSTMDSGLPYKKRGGHAPSNN